MNNEQQIQEKLAEISNLIEGRFNDDEALKDLAEKAAETNTRKGYVIFRKEIEESADLYNRLVQIKGGREEKANSLLHRIEELTDEIKDLENQLQLLFLVIIYNFKPTIIYSFYFFF